MRRASLILLSALLCVCASAQNNLGAADDADRIILTPFVAENASFPEYVANTVKNKLTQLASQYGVAGTCFDQRFIITANFTELTKEATATTPPMIALDLSPTLYIGDISTGALFASCSLPSLKGVGKNETKAYMAAIKGLKLNDPAIASFVEQGKSKIIEYYNSQIDFLLSQADALCGQDDFDGAIALLMTVPSVCKDAYKKAMSKSTAIFQKKIDKEGAILLNTARQVWNADQSYAGAQEAGEYLAQIHPNSSSYSDASKLSSEIAKRIKEVDKREWDFKLQQHNDEVKLESQAIEAAKAIGVAKAKQPITYNTKVYWW